MNAPPGIDQGTAAVLAALMLVLEFGMLRQALVGTRCGCTRRSPRSSRSSRSSSPRQEPARPVRARRAVGRTEGGRRSPGTAPSAARGADVSAAGGVEEEVPGIAGSYTLSPASAVLA